MWIAPQVTYNGSLPYTHAPVSEYNNSGAPSIRGRHPGPFPATEHWAAFVDDHGYGMGIVTLETDKFVSSDQLLAMLT